MNFAVMLSGGVGTRMRSDGFPKQYLEVEGKPVIMYALEPFLACEDIDEIVIVASPVWKERIMEWLKVYNVAKPVSVVQNGNTRQESLMNGLLACAGKCQLKPQDKVLIHEAVRPLVNARIIRDCIAALDKYDSCLPVVPIHDSTYVSYDKITASEMIDRDKIFCGQAPEGFRLKMYLELNQNSSSVELATIRGSSELSLIKGHTVGLIEGDPNNFKLTRPSDLQLFKAHLIARTLQEE